MNADLRRQYRALYTASVKEPTLVSVPKLLFLAIDGAGELSGPEFQDAVGALYGAAGAIRTAIKAAEPANDYRTMPLEGLWWCEGADHFDVERRDAWRWTLMILQPDFVTRPSLKAALLCRGCSRPQRQL
jgi:hypothetical protein